MCVPVFFKERIFFCVFDGKAGKNRFIRLFFMKTTYSEGKSYINFAKILGLFHLYAG
jgi:hypothetical protein